MGLQRVAQLVKNPPAMQETWVQFLGWEDPLEKGKATHSSILAWTIPWTEELVGYSPYGRKESDMTEQLSLSLCRYADDNAIMAESEEELKNHLMKVKEESEKVV